MINWLYYVYKESTRYIYKLDTILMVAAIRSLWDCLNHASNEGSISKEFIKLNAHIKLNWWMVMHRKWYPHWGNVI